MFCHVTRTWRGRPLMTVDDAVAGIAATVTAGGLKCTAVRDDNAYPAGIEVSDARMRYLQDRVLERDPFHGGWNYAFLPAPRPAPEPEPAPGPPGRVPRDALNHPALTGMRPHDLESDWPRPWKYRSPPAASSRTTPTAAAAASTPSATAAPPAATAGSTSPTTSSPPASAAT